MTTHNRSRHASSLRIRLAGLAATIAMLAVVAGLPAILLTVGANPLPNQVPSWNDLQAALGSPDDGTLFLSATAVVAWVAWAFITISILLEVLSALRGVQAPQLPALPGLRPTQGTARSLVATAALLFIAAPVFPQPAWTGGASASAAGPADTTHTAAVSQPAHGHPRTDTRGPATNPSGRYAEHDPGDKHFNRPATKPHRVGAGETLWSLARTYLGDGARYPEIAELNRDVLGDDPGFLEVDWVLRVPDTDKGNAQTTDAPPNVQLEDGERAVTVKANDTLSELAEAELDDPSAYPEIFEASKDITQPGGAHLTDADMINVGWTLVIPADRADTGRMGGSGAGEREASSAGNGRNGPGAQQGGQHSPPSQDSTDPPPDPPETSPADSQDDRAAGPPETASAGPDRVDQEDKSDQASDTQGSDEVGSSDVPWLLIGLTGGGAVLAAGLHRGLQVRRRAQWRARRPGRAVAVPGPELAPVEKTINTTGTAAATTVEFMDEALRQLAGQRARQALPMPAIAAVELNPHHLVLHLTDPTTLDAPWDGTTDALHWRCDTDVDPEDLGPLIKDLVDQPAPYPMLVTIGSSDDGDVWLLNLEELAAVTISGDPTRGRDFARYLAAELAMNRWSEGIVVDCVGIAEEVAPMERDRIRYHQPGAEGERAAAETLADAVAAIDRSHMADTDVVTGRAAQISADVWPARLLLLDVTDPSQPSEPGAPTEVQTTVSGASSEPASLPDLLRLAVDQTGHTGTAVVIAGERPGSPGTVLHLTSNGRVQLDAAGLDLIAVGLTSEEAHGCAALLAQSEDLSDTELPVDESVEDGWEAYATQSGSLRTEYTLPRGTATGDASGAATVSHLDGAGPDVRLEPTPATSGEIETDDGAQDDRSESLLSGPDQDYVAAAAATAHDLAALAPQVPVSVRAQVEAATPTLDKDVADWFDAHTNRPKLTLLGPVIAQAHGKALVERRAYFTELLTFLALRRRHGVTPDEVAAAFNLQPPKVRGYVKVVRDWLGTNPATAAKHLPDATAAPATKKTGVNVYQVDDGLLVDADLFRRLWARGQSRGPAGMLDLRQALDLVVGRPFDQLRKGAWSWLLEGDRIDLQMQAAVADVAHLVATHGLTTGDLDLARYAIEKAMLAAPDEDTTQFNRAALAAAEGFPEEAERILRDEVCNRSDDGHAPRDLTERAEAILRNHDWLATG